jgi:hypothetical protein
MRLSKQLLRHEGGANTIAAFNFFDIRELFAREDPGSRL